jgi:UPF0176 protein
LLFRGKYDDMMTPSTACSTAKRGLHKVLALYKFVLIPAENIRLLQVEIEKHLLSNRARGTILLAREGINGTICYPIRDDIRDMEGILTNNVEGDDPVLQYLNSHRFFSGARTRISYAETAVFHRLKVKVKREIVTMLGGDEEDQDVHKEKQLIVDPQNSSNLDLDPCQRAGLYVKPGKEWDDLLLDPDVVVIDTRNKYEVEMGTFQNAINPYTDNFRQFPQWLQKFGEACRSLQTRANHNETVMDTGCNYPDSSSQPITHENASSRNCRSTEPVPFTSLPTRLKGPPKAVAMFCTGGIRCEKSTRFCLQEEIFPSNVPIYHLEGGILAYLEHHTDPEKSLWNGDCFVFDHRVAVTHGLKPSATYELCYACRRPLTLEDRSGQDYIKGVCCKYCRDECTDDDRERFINRQKQIMLANERGTRHIYDPKEEVGHVDDKQ